MEEEKKNEEAQKELKVKDMFSIVLDYKVKEDDSFSVTMSAEKDCKILELKVFDEDFLGMALDGLKAVMGYVSRLYVDALHKNGKMTDEEYSQLLNRKQSTTT